MMDVLFITDPLVDLLPGHDTSVALMEAASQRGHRVLATTAERLSFGEGTVWAPCSVLDVRPAVLESGHWITDVEWHSARAPQRYNLTDAGLVFMRTDPPVNDRYWRATYLLDRVEATSTIVVNNPAGLRHANEKLFVLEFPELTPATIVTADRDEIRTCIDRWGCGVLKPTDAMAGRGIFLLDAADANLSSILDSSTDRGARQVVVQQWIPEVTESGDRRILLVDGEPVGALQRLAAGVDFRCNMATGGSIRADEVNDRDRELCAAIAPALRRHGLHFVGLDVIGGLITEINVTSPTGIREIDALSGTSLAHDVMSWAEEAHRRRARDPRDDLASEQR